ncbi:MAG: sulfurtransferase TusA family protein [Geminicoccaceae bacterium]|nr:sulfurtransferase TusA family protein [Geminicoccaceae bacterium]
MTAESKTILVDARGLSCPMPLLKARQALMLLDRGARVTVLATDPAAPLDFENFCEAGAHDLVESIAVDGIYKITLEKGSGR